MSSDCLYTPNVPCFAVCNGRFISKLLSICVYSDSISPDPLRIGLILVTFLHLSQTFGLEDFVLLL